ncbi:MAG: hypothetical protein WAK04_17930, partial [Xanthobacteraceae bacterium]
LGADSEEKREPASDIDIAVVVSLKALDLNRPIREADILQTHSGVRPWGWTVFMRQADRVES